VIGVVGDEHTDGVDKKSSDNCVLAALSEEF
jgi:hypothetical protein